EPYMDALGEALQGMAAFLEGNPDRRPQFRALIQRVKEAYPDRERWDLDLVLLADRHHFPGWAVECLPSLFFVCDAKDNARTVLLWQPLSGYLEETLMEKYCAGGRIVQSSVSKEIPQWFYTLAEKVEERRNDFPLYSERALRGAVSDLLA